MFASGMARGREVAGSAIMHRVRQLKGLTVMPLKVQDLAESNVEPALSLVHTEIGSIFTLFVLESFEPGESQLQYEPFFACGDRIFVSLLNRGLAAAARRGFLSAASPLVCEPRLFSHF